ncbi:hypothetical protein E2C01_081692 [Portunus trituberculatus]|uniref:Uncharacterized protein n=1 Tax=Portunus trituberculatus TaxID=210409 RepID=A0A5B7IYT5_PORTR|nr:hypothetical protein [Portunus trituberculatus]
MKWHAAQHAHTYLKREERIEGSPKVHAGLEFEVRNEAVLTHQHELGHGRTPTQYEGHHEHGGQADHLKSEEHL